MTIHASGYVRDAALKAQFFSEQETRARLKGYPRDAETLDSVNSRFSSYARNKQTEEGRAQIEAFEKFRRESEERELVQMTQDFLARYGQ